MACYLFVVFGDSKAASFGVVIGTRSSAIDHATVLHAKVSLGWRRDIFRREGGGDLLEARIAAQRVQTRDTLKAS